MSYKNSVDSTGTLFFTRYADPSQRSYVLNAVNPLERQRFRSTFQASKLGDQRKMDEIQNMFNNYNLFKYGQVATSAGKKRHSTNSLPSPENNPNRHKNLKERTKDNLLLKERLVSMKNERQGLFDKLQEITTKNPRKAPKLTSSVVSENI